jgi:penicillin-binding protein 1A
METNDGEPGQDKVVTKQVVPPGVAATARTILHTVVTQGTGTNAYTGDPSEWGKTGTTEDNGDAWFVGATKEITVAVWVGHADSVKPMRTEYGGGPVDGGTIPALIFNDVLTAYEQLNGGNRSDRHPPAPTAPPASAPAATTPATPTTTTPAPAGGQGAQDSSQQRSSQQEPSQPQQQQQSAPSDGSGAGQSGGGAPATGGTG